MDLTFTEQQEILRKTARDFLGKECPSSFVRKMAQDEVGYTVDLWRKMAEMGWMGLVFPERYEGAGGGFLDLVVLLEEMGQACLPGPFFSTVVLGGLAILAAGSEEQKQEFLPKIARGELVLSLAWAEPGSGFGASAIATRAIRDGDSYVINGTKLFVNDAHIADYLVCVAGIDDGPGSQGGIGLFLVEAKSPGIECTVLETLGLDKQCEVVFTEVKVRDGMVLGGAEKAGGALETVLQQAAVGKCADMVGSARAAFESAVSYAKQRIQYGHPIGSFQAIQHHCANMAVDIDGAALITYEAAWSIDGGLPSARLVSMAKSWVNEACQRVTLLGHQIYGGIGFCRDQDMHLYYRRVRAGGLTFGDTVFHRKVVARELLQGAPAFSRE